MADTLFSNFSTPTKGYSLYASAIPRSTATGWHSFLVQSPRDAAQPFTLVSEFQDKPNDSKLYGIEFQLTIDDSVSKWRIPIAVVVRCPATPTISDARIAEPSQDGLLRQTNALTDLLCRKTLFFVDFGDKFGRSFSRQMRTLNKVEHIEGFACRPGRSTI